MPAEPRRLRWEHWTTTYRRMIQWILTLLPFSAVLVYLDASKHRIGVTPNNDSKFFNMSAGGWGIATLLICIVALPAYLIKRDSLLELASTHPVKSQKRLAKAVALGAVALLWVEYQTSFAADEEEAPSESETAEATPELTPEVKMEANALSYRLLVLERGISSCVNDIHIAAMQAPCKEAVNECVGRAELAFRRGDAAEGSIRLAAQEYEACYFPTVTAKIAAMNEPSQ
jgi:hypothetical protein